MMIYRYRSVKANELSLSLSYKLISYHYHLRLLFTLRNSSFAFANCSETGLPQTDVPPASNCTYS